MSNAELHFKSKETLSNWLQVNMPESYAEYLLVKEKVNNFNFPGAKSLLKNQNGDDLANFLSFLSELNIANILIERNVINLKYEPDPGQDIDFSFDNIDMSAKNIGTKDYEKEEHQEISKLKEVGGGKIILNNKSVSDTQIEVDSNDFGTDSFTRIETSNNGQLGSDITQMQTVLFSLGKFESKIINNGKKKVILFSVYTSNFNDYHALDAALWYFNKTLKDYTPIFNDQSLYLKLFNSATKLNNIDAIVFLFPPNPIIWPKGSLGEIVQEKRRRMIFSENEELHKELKELLS